MTGKCNSGFVRPGIQSQDDARLASRLRLDCRFEEQVLGSNGYEHSTGFDYLGDYGQEWSNWDFSRIGLRQNFTKVVNPDLRVGLQGRWACNYNNFSPSLESTWGDREFGSGADLD